MTMFRNSSRWLAGVALAILAGCSENQGMVSGHPESSASAPASEASSGQPAKTLRPDDLDSPAATSIADAQRSAEMTEKMKGHASHAGHGGGTYVQTDAGRAEGAPAEPEHHHDHGTAAPAASAYACPMHPEVTSTAPGKCPKCGMDLVERREP